MSSVDPDENKPVLYLEEIDIQTATKANFRLKLQIDGRDVETQRNGTISWIPSRSLEFSDTSKITVTIKAGMKFVRFGKPEALVAVSSEEAMQAFWGSKDLVSCPTTFEGQLTTVTFKFRPSQTSETTRAAVQKLQTTMENYRSLMTSSTEQRIDTVIKYGVVVSEMNPFAKVAFSLVKVAFDLLKEQRKYDVMVSDLASGIGRVLPFATQVLEDVLYGETELLERAIRKLYDLIADTATFICGYAKRSCVSRAAKSTISLEDHRRIEDLQDHFAELKEDFDRAINVESLTLARKTEELRLLERLKPVDTAGYQRNRGCMDGTRTAVLDDIMNWASKPLEGNTEPNNSNEPNVFWLYGIPGLGKTSVANSLCRLLHNSKSLGGSFFCRHDDPILREPKSILPTLIYRLAGMWSSYRKVVAHALQDDPQLTPDSSDGDLLLESLRLLNKHPSRPLVPVIDALDECGDPHTRGPVLKCLLDATSHVQWLKIVITSRPVHDISSLLDKPEVATRDLATDDTARKDIQLFARNRMASVAKDRHLAADWPGEDCLHQIVERSGGLFIFVETVSRFVNEDPDPEQPLRLVLDGELEEANAELHKLYSTAVASRIGPRAKAFGSIARAILGVATYRPLCEETLASLLGWELRIVNSWVDDLSSLLYRDESHEGQIRARHLSIIDFLTGPTCPPDFRVDLGLANAELGLHCLVTMRKHLRFNICGLETSCLPNADIQGLQDRVQQKVPDALQYSCMYWFKHLCSDLNPASVEVSELLDKFFADERPLYWLEALSVMGKVPLAVSGLRQIKACIKKFRGLNRHSVDDMLRFVLAFYTPILTSTPHIYVSALPFMPMESSVWKNTERSFPNLLKVCKGRMESWPILPDVWLGHSSHVHCIAYSPDALRIVSGSSDKTIRIWDAETGMAVGEPLRGHTKGVTSVAYSPNGLRIVSGSYDETIRIWDAETGAPASGPLRGHTDGVSSVAYSPDCLRIISGSHDDTIRIWDAETGAPVGEPMRGHTSGVCGITHSPDGLRIVSGGGDHTIRVWDAETGVALGEPLRGHTSAVSSVAYSPGGLRIVSGSYDKTIRIWNAETGAPPGEPLRGHTLVVSSVAYSPDGLRITSGSHDNTIRNWDAETGVAMGEPVKGHSDWVSSVAYSPDGSRIVSGSYDDTIRNWDAETGLLVGEPLKGHTRGLLGIAYSPDGLRIVSGSYDGTVRVWDAETGVAIGEPLRGHTKGVTTVGYSPDGLRIVSGSYDQTVRIWQAEAGTAVGEPLRGHNDWVSSVAYSPDGSRIVSGSHDDTIRIWDAETGAPVGEPLKGHTNRAHSVAYSPDGLHIVSGSRDKTVRIWDAGTGVPVGEPLMGHTDWVSSVAYSPDSLRVVSGSHDGTIRIWDAETGLAMGEPLRGHARGVTSIAYSPDGSRIVSGSYDHTIRLWDAETGTALGEPLRGHAWTVYSVGYSPGGHRIVSGSRDDTIRIWDAGRGIENGGPSVRHTSAAELMTPLPDDQNVLPDSSGHSADIRPVGAFASPNRSSVAAFSGFAIPAELLDSNGWVRDANGLLFWVPEDCRNGLTCPAIITTPNTNTSRHRPVRIDFTHFRYGTSWADVYGGHIDKQE